MGSDPFSRIIFCNCVQLRNAQQSMVLTLRGIIREVISVQFSKALSPMLVTLSGITISFRLVFENALFPIDLTLFGITISVRLVFENAPFPIIFTLSGIVTDDNPVQPLSPLTEVILLPNVTVNGDLKAKGLIIPVKFLPMYKLLIGQFEIDDPVRIMLPIKRSSSPSSKTIDFKPLQFIKSSGLNWVTFAPIVIEDN